MEIDRNSIPHGPEEMQPASPAATSSQPSPEPPSTIHRIFFGRFGLRAGYGIVLWLVAFFALSIAGGLLSVAATGQLHAANAVRQYAKLHPNLPHPHFKPNFVPGLVIASDGVTFFGLLAVCWLLGKGERRPLHVYGVGRKRIGDLLPGSLCGLLMLSAVILTLRSEHLLVFDGQALHGPAIFLYGLKWLAAFFLVGLSEEYSFRGYLQYTLMRGVWGLAEQVAPNRTRAVAFWIAATLMSALFGLAHVRNGGETLFGLLQVFLAGMVFAYALWRTGSLWWGIGFHMTWDWSQSFLFGVADSGYVSVGRLLITHPVGKVWLSGGTDGPEGSIFASLALLLTLGLIHVARPGVQPALEPEPRARHSLSPATPDLA